ncbi:hypothetical protein K503DRAFT_766924 [Rhizopogon vinicolor AM-OR11-026]|uniref:F-box domain-containing protein n=1 Tax=Rhizopogon vinicolor AM-OR11-026 TaxID=1314800 RepID=A0A1B7NBM1_9AGAM|nr:hypothetical protein K503DRAFT_766924 [Rhizopogon vinicolor AM-OR11-026]
MSWKASFQQGVSNFKRDNYLESLACFDEAISLGCDTFIVYDSRAAVHEKLGNYKAALIDAKKVVDTAPDRWQGYARSARLFHALQKDEAALKMIDLALERIKADDTHRSQELDALKYQAIDALNAADERRRARIAKTAYHIGKLPVEILVEVFSIVVAADHAQILKLSHICKHWRGIAIETPSLWNTLVVSKNRPKRKIQLWVQRAHKHISVLSFHHNILEIDWSSILEELIPLSWYSLRSLTVSGRLFSQIYDFLRRLSKTDVIPRLKHLDVTDTDFTKISSSFEDYHLESLKISGLTPAMNELWTRVHRLKTMNIEHAGWLDISPAVLANPSLESLILNNFIPPPSNVVNDRVQLPNLLCMKLNNIPAPVSEVTRSFVAPNLQILHLFSVGLSRDGLLEFMRAPPLALRELRLGSCTPSINSLKIILAGAPLLETLQISGVHGVVNDMLHFISGTNPNDNHQDVCPLLKHVDLSNCADLLTGSAYSLVKTRLRSDQLVIGDESQPGCRAEIESLKLDGCHNIEGEMLPWFRGKVKVFSCVYMSKKEANRRR